jgi:hypothetical protein
MPAIIGGVRLISVSSGGQFVFGDVGAIVPKHEAKAYGGSGVFNSGDVARTINVANSTNTNDQDLADGNIRTMY